MCNKHDKYNDHYYNYTNHNHVYDKHIHDKHNAQDNYDGDAALLHLFSTGYKLLSCRLPQIEWRVFL